MVRFADYPRRLPDKMGIAEMLIMQRRGLSDRISASPTLTGLQETVSVSAVIRPMAVNRGIRSPSGPGLTGLAPSRSTIRP